MRHRDGRYSLLFEEYINEGPLIISPSMTFEVPVRVLSGLMSLGYSIGAIIKRASTVYRGERFSAKFDSITQLKEQGRFFQIEGRDRAAVEEAGRALGLEGTYVPRSYIEQARGPPHPRGPSPARRGSRCGRCPFRIALVCGGAHAGALPCAPWSRATSPPAHASAYVTGATCLCLCCRCNWSG